MTVDQVINDVLFERQAQYRKGMITTQQWHTTVNNVWDILVRSEQTPYTMDMIHQIEGALDYEIR